MTQGQLTELLESEGARSMIETGEERGWIEPAELEAFALEHELQDVDIEELTRELERIGLEVRERAAAEDDKSKEKEEVVYEAERSHLKIVLVGPPGDTAKLLGLIRVWLEQLKPDR